MDWPEAYFYQVRLWLLVVVAVLVVVSLLC